MNKKIYLVLDVILIFLTLSGCGSGNTRPDSFTFEESDLTKANIDLSDTENSIVFRVYQVPNEYFFTLGLGMDDDWCAYDPDLKKYYDEFFIQADEDNVSKITLDGWGGPMEEGFANNWRPFIKYMNEPQSLFEKTGQKVKIKRVFCLVGFNKSPEFIYFETNKGDYVYYKYYDEFLVPIKEFRLYTINLMNKIKGSANIFIPESCFEELEPYKIPED